MGPRRAGLARWRRSAGVAPLRVLDLRSYFTLPLRCQGSPSLTYHEPDSGVSSLAFPDPGRSGPTKGRSATSLSHSPAALPPALAPTLATPPGRTAPRSSPVPDFPIPRSAPANGTTATASPKSRARTDGPSLGRSSARRSGPASPLVHPRGGSPRCSPEQLRGEGGRAGRPGTLWSETRDRPLQAEPSRGRLAFPQLQRGLWGLPGRGRGGAPRLGPPIAIARAVAPSAFARSQSVRRDPRGACPAARPGPGRTERPAESYRALAGPLRPQRSAVGSPIRPGGLHWAARSPAPAIRAAPPPAGRAWRVGPRPGPHPVLRLCASGIALQPHGLRPTANDIGALPGQGQPDSQYYFCRMPVSAAHRTPPSERVKSLDPGFRLPGGKRDGQQAWGVHSCGQLAQAWRRPVLDQDLCWGQPQWPRVSFAAVRLGPCLHRTGGEACTETHAVVRDPLGALRTGGQSRPSPPLPTSGASPAPLFPPTLGSLELLPLVSTLWNGEVALDAFPSGPFLPGT